MNIEELAFKNYFELKEIQKVDLLLIIEFLQKDRKQWINQYTQAHNDYVVLQQENQQLKEWKELHSALILAKENIRVNKENQKLLNDYCRLDARTKTQQKEFIKHLEDNETKFDITANGMGASSERDELIIKARAYREILSKYKEIVGSDKNE